MVHILSLFLCLAIVYSYCLPIEARGNGPAPVSIGFSVLKMAGNTTAKDFWSRFGAERAKRDGYPVAIADYRDISYNIDIYLGSDSQKSTVSLDTGSSDLWVPSSDYDPSTSSSSSDTGDAFSIGYVDGSESAGEYYLDTLHFQTPEPVLSGFQFARSTVSSGSGILGVADRNQEAASSRYNNLPWALQAAGVTPKASYSLYLGSEGGSGTVIFGGIDTEKYHGNLAKYSIHSSRGALAVDVQTMLVNGKTVLVGTPAILDSGTSLGLLTKELMSELDEVFDTTVYVLGSIEYRKVSCNQPLDQYVEFDFGNNTIKIAYSEMVFDQGNGHCLLGFGYYDDYMIFGDVFLRQAYVYYDLTDLTISLAQASYASSSNIISA